MVPQWLVEFILKNKRINDELNNHFVKISMAEEIEDLMSFKWSKVTKSIALFAKVFGLILVKKTKGTTLHPRIKVSLL